MAMKARYTVMGGEILSQTRNGVKHNYVPDPTGNVVALYDSNQAKTDTVSYRPYGEVIARTGSTPLPFQFHGAIGHYSGPDGRAHVGPQRFNPQVGRWNSPKQTEMTTGQTAYGYAGNDPVNSQDMGKQVIDKDLAKCLAKCAGKKGQELAKCLRTCLGNKFWSFCPKIVCWVKPEECPQGCDPCDKKNCNYVKAECDCCDVKYQCCLIRNPTGLGPRKCLTQHTNCNLSQGCADEASNCLTPIEAVS